MKSPKAFIAVSTVALIALLTAARSVYYVQLDNDGMRYGLVADQILKGRGLRKPVMLGHVHWDTPPDSLGTIPYASEAPLLPALFALMGGVRPGRLWPGQALNICAHVISSLFTFIIARRLAGNVAGVAAGIIVAVSYPLLRVAGHLWTESLFIALVMVTVGLLQASRLGNARRGCLFGSGIAAASAFAIRWAGVALMPLLLWEAIVVWKHRGIHSAIRTILLTVPIPLIVIVALLTRNFLVTGTMRGVWLPHTGRSLMGALLLFMGFTAKQLGICGSDLKVTLAAVLLGFPCGALLLSPTSRNEISKLCRRGLDLVIIAAACYTGVITYSLAGDLPVPEPRFVAPLVPLISIIAVVVIVRGWRAVGRKRMRRLASFGMAVTLVLIGVREATRSIRLLPRQSECLLLRYGESEWCKWVVSHCEPGSILVTNIPSTVTFYSGISSFRPPHRGQSPFVRIPPDMDELLPRKMKEIGARYLLLVDVGDGLPEEKWGEFFAALSRREAVSDKLTLVREWPGDTLLYRLKE